MALTEPQKLWVEALRSGKYKQGKFRLKRDNEYCCLGVGAQLGVEHGVISSFHGDFPTLGKVPEIQQWLGLKDGCAIFGEREESLTVLNDNGATFEQIANIIESEPEGLFVPSECRGC